MGAELGYQVVDVLFAEGVKLGLDHELIERATKALVIVAKLADRHGVGSFVVIEEVPFLAIDVRTKTSINLAKDLQYRREVGPFDCIGQIGEPLFDCAVITAQGLAYVHLSLFSFRARMTRIAPNGAATGSSAGECVWRIDTTVANAFAKSLLAMLKTLQCGTKPGTNAAPPTGPSHAGQGVIMTLKRIGHIAVLLGPDFEDAEFTHPVAKLREAGHAVEVLGTEPHRELEGKRHDAKVETDAAVRDRVPEDYDAVLIPGGFSPDRLRTDESMVGFVRKFDRLERPIAAICHGPQLLIEAGIVEGRKLTSWPSVRTDLRNAGAEVVDEEVCEDGHLITSRKPEDLDAFTSALLDAVSEERRAATRKT